jgi:hypothetical protein
MWKCSAALVAKRKQKTRFKTVFSVATKCDYPRIYVMSPKWSPPSKFPDHNSVRIYHLPNACCMSRPFHPP